MRMCFSGVQSGGGNVSSENPGLWSKKYSSTLPSYVSYAAGTHSSLTKSPSHEMDRSLSPWEVAMVDDATAALTRLNLWTWFMAYSGSFLSPITPDDSLKLLMLGREMTIDHSGASFAWVLRRVHTYPGGAGSAGSAR